MIKMRTFFIEDLVGFRPKEFKGNLQEVMTANIENNSRHVVSILKDNLLVAITGMNFLRPGVAELWLIPGVLVDSNKFEFYKSVKSLIYGYVFQELQIHRLEMAIRADWQKGIKWAESLGFLMEGYMREWDDNKDDHLLFAKVVQ